MDAQKDTIVNRNESDLKDLIVDFVGNKVNPPNDEVKMEHIAEVFMEQFPEMLVVMAEENWINGYTQALSDMDFMLQNQKKSAEEEKKKLNGKQ